MASLPIYWPSVEQVMDSDIYQTTAEKFQSLCLELQSACRITTNFFMNTLVQEGRKARRQEGLFFFFFLHIIEKIDRGSCARSPDGFLVYSAILFLMLVYELLH